LFGQTNLHKLIHFRRERPFPPEDDNPTRTHFFLPDQESIFERMLARIQQVTTLLMLAAASFVLSVVWHHSMLLALALFCVTLFSYSLPLAAQFAGLRWINKGDPVPRATGLELFWAWWIEVLTAAKVFMWWQPFRSSQHADNIAQPGAMQGRRGLVLVHGFLCNRALWWRWFPELERRNVPFVAVNLEPVFGSVDDYADTLNQAVLSLQKATGVAPILVCHSMGGLVARAWLAAQGVNAGVQRVVTIGTPHHGTRIGERLMQPLALKNATQMRRGSAWLQTLALKELNAPYSSFTCYYSDCDNIVTPTSAATLNGADNRLRQGVPHVALALDGQIMRETLQML
jgi:pimeloyl-ACP methyl ester carboxylesterase